MRNKTKIAKENQGLNREGIKAVILFYQTAKERRIAALMLEKKRIDHLLEVTKHTQLWQLCRRYTRRQMIDYKGKIEKKIAKLIALADDFAKLASRLTADDVEIMEEEFLAEFGKIISEKQTVQKNLSLKNYPDADFFEKKLASW